MNLEDEVFVDEVLGYEVYKKRLKLFEETSFEAITVYDENTKCIDLNKQTTTIFQYTREEVLGMSGFDFFAPEFKEKAIKSVKNRSKVPYEAIMMRKDGTRLIGLIQGTTIKVGERILRVSTCRDITDLKDVQNKLEQKDAEFETIFNDSQVGIVVLDPKRTIVRANNAVAKIFGFSSFSELVDQNIALFHLNQESYQTFGKLYHSELIEGKAIKFDYQFKHKSGNPIWLTVSGTVIDKAKPPDLNKGIIWVVDDISKRKEAEEQLKEAHDELESIFSNTMMGVLVLKDNNRVHRVNQRFVDILGYTNVTEWKGKSLENFHLTQLELEKLIKTFKTDLINHNVKEIDIELCKKDGTPTWISVSGKAIDSSIPAELSKGVIWVISDINRRKEAEFQLQERNKELQEMNINKDKFISILAHDLKGPLGMGVKFLEVLLRNFDKYDKETLKTKVSLIHKNLGKTYGLLDEVLDWIKSQLGREKINLIEFDFLEVCEMINEGFNARAKEKNIKIDCFEIESLVLNTDKDMFRTIIRNLISNAIKFTPENGEIFITATKQINYINISVVDNGVGIANNKIAALWEYSGMSSLGTNNETGTGMGLKLCKELVEKLGGTIGVNSELGEGSEFYFTLPMPTE